MSRPLILYVLDSLEEDDVGDEVATLLEHLSRSRYEPRVVTLGPRGSLGVRLRQMKVTAHRLDVGGILGSVLAVRRLRRLITGLGAQLVHAFQPWSGTVAQIAAPRGVRVFRTIADGRSSGESRLGSALARGALARGNARFFVSEEGMRDAVRARMGVEEVGVIPACVDIVGVRERVTGEAAREEARIGLGMEPDQHGVVCVTDFTDRSVLRDILEAFVIARTERPGLRLFFLGKGPEEGAARWEAEELRLDDSVVFMGAWPERWSLLAACDAVVDAGSWPGWSRSAMEGMAAGRPVAHYRAEEDGRAQNHDAISGPPLRLARRLLTLVWDEGVREELVRLSAERVASHGVATVARQWEEAYEGEAPQE